MVNHIKQFRNGRASAASLKTSATRQYGTNKREFRNSLIEDKNDDKNQPTVDRNQY